MSSPLSLVTDLSQSTILAAYQLDSFLQASHQHIALIPEDLRAIIAHIVSNYPLPANAPLQIPTARTTRAGSAAASRKSSVSKDTSSPAVAWVADWAIDRSRLRSNVRSFKQRVRPFTITPPSNSQRGSATTKEIPRTMASNSSGGSNSGAQNDNNYQDSGFSERQYQAMQAMITAALARP